MHRIDSPGFAPGNLFTEGNPSLNIPATEVSDDWLNDVQEEIAKFIESRGITLVKGTQTQLTDAILNAIGAGGTNIKIDPLLNNTADQDITGLIFDKLVTKSAIVFFDIHRRTDTSNVQETGAIVVTHDTEDDQWRTSILMSSLDDSGTDFNVVVDTGQVRIGTGDLVGAAYAGQLRITGITRFSL